MENLEPKEECSDLLPFPLLWGGVYCPCASSVALVVKSPHARAGDLRDTELIPGWGIYPGGRHGSSPQYSWSILWTEEPGGLQSTGSQRAGHQ